MSEKSITILGSTGSIGKNTVDIIRRYPEKYRVKALTGNQNVALLAEQAVLLKAETVVTANKAKYQELKELLSGTSIRVEAGNEAVAAAAAEDADWTMSSIVGAAGLIPTMEVIKRGKTLALANKETLVCAGEIVMKAIKEYKTTLVPVDSEHSAIFQTLEEKHRGAVDRILLTASGGPFREKDLAFMENVTPEQAVAHPNWNMGAKISVDSATMMNKGLEIIEAYHLFGFPAEKIEVLVHPQSIVHSAVGYKDGSVLAHMGMPDMRTPIAYALAYPERMESPTAKLDFTKIAALTFSHPDETRFPALRLAKECLAKGQTATAIMNAANEVAVSAFLNRKIGFLDIARTAEKVVKSSSLTPVSTIEEVIAADAEAREAARHCIEERIKN
ncbi:MAG: 1-deoxy-D-xylulose-5-phosphate reductoisomerase [Alphaproteobacteria bacterium]|nr:1-deoxy-D-xylulose-5-phosphate reductoisomerase [Alphaproteobacteria bacterium]MBO4643199.1 1-deoxy-D-xylulose-5-phosphate reductoisomerase [Alphaproteobacteria bacterium]